MSKLISAIRTTSNKRLLHNNNLDHALYLAVKSNDINKVKLLLSLGVKFDKKYTLNLAIKNNHHIEIITLILQNGERLKFQDFVYATKQRRFDIIKLLIWYPISFSLNKLITSIS